MTNKEHRNKNNKKPSPVNMKKGWMSGKFKKRVIPFGIILIGILLCSYPIWYLLQTSNSYKYNLSLEIKINQDNSSILYLPIIIDEHENPAEINSYITIVSGQADIRIINITDIDFIKYPIAFEIHSQGDVIIQAHMSYRSVKRNQDLINSILSQQPSLQNRTADYKNKPTVFIFMDNTSTSSNIDIGWKFQFTYKLNKSKDTSGLLPHVFGFKENLLQSTWQEINITYKLFYLD